jgi:heme/copper-type cytochrome/quinol oxidase subunit 3
MEASASAPQPGREIEPEPPEWQPRVIWVGGRLLCGSISFFFASFVFAYFYLRALNTNHNWTIGPVHPAGGLGLTIMALYVGGAIIFRLAARRGEVDELVGATIAVLFTLTAIALQFLEYTVLDFGAASGGYAAVFFGFTSAYAIVALMGIYWIETQAASLWRVRREGTTRVTEVPTSEAALLRAGLESSSFYWAYFATIGLLAYIILYLVGP